MFKVPGCLSAPVSRWWPPPSLGQDVLLLRKTWCWIMWSLSPWYGIRPSEKQVHAAVRLSLGCASLNRVFFFSAIHCSRALLKDKVHFLANTQSERETDQSESPNWAVEGRKVRGLFIQHYRQVTMTGMQLWKYCAAFEFVSELFKGWHVMRTSLDSSV